MLDTDTLNALLSRVRSEAIYNPAIETSAEAVEIAQTIIDELGLGSVQSFLSGESVASYFAADPPRTLESALARSASNVAAWDGQTVADRYMSITAVCYWIHIGGMEEAIGAVLRDPSDTGGDEDSTTPKGPRLVPSWLLDDLSGIKPGI